MPGVAGAMKSFLTSLCHNTRGTTTIEYAMLCGMIVLAIIAAVRGLGTENGGQWANMSSKASTAMQGAGN
jgi:pilus assembly protein Flp/PilA